MKFKVTLITVADLTMEVDATDEDAALDAAYERARDFAAQRHGGHDYEVSINDAWDLREPEVTQS